MVLESAGGGVLDIEPQESAGALGEVDCCLEQATMAKALMHNKRRLRFIDHLCVSGSNRLGSVTAPGRGSTFRRKRCSTADSATPASSRSCQGGGYFLAAIRFFFLAGSFGRDLPKEP